MGGSYIKKEAAGIAPYLKITIVETQISRLGGLGDAKEVATVAYTTPKWLRQLPRLASDYHWICRICETPNLKPPSSIQCLSAT
jgi:hypothetical protein